MKLWLALVALGSVLGSGAASATVFTDPAGGSQPFSQYQPSLVLNEIVMVQGSFPTGSSDGIPSNYLGMIRTSASTYPGGPKAQGQLLPINQNQALFALYGTNYGGNGTTSFALPNLTGRAVVGSGFSGADVFLAGQQLGSAATTLTQDQMPTHVHDIVGEPFTTGPAGGSQPFDNYQPSLTLNYIIAMNDGLSADRPFAGEVALNAGSVVPNGYMLAQGQVIPIADAPTLFERIGTTYGGDGVNTFRLPDLTGRTAVGVTDQLPLGTIFGSSSVTLDGSQLAVHDHTATGFDIDAAGGGQPFDNAQPSLALYYLIRAEGIFPDSEHSPSDTSFISEIVMSASPDIPDGFLRAEGQLLQISDYEALFFLIGTTFGGDGVNTFELPDLRGYTMIGTGTGFTLGDRFGERMTTLTEANLPSHVHSIDVAGSVPEPGTWVMLMAGFGLMGMFLRRQHRPSIA